MTRYLLDTTALIDFSKGREPARSRIQAWIDGGDELGVCAVNVAEFYAGLPPQQRALWEQFLGALQLWEITRDAAIQAGIWRYDFARQGVALTTTDTLVAAVTQEQQAVLVTNNLKDYPMSGLQLLPLK
jgi:predicted nucleic acid-binding protein